MALLWNVESINRDLIQNASRDAWPVAALNRENSGRLRNRKPAMTHRCGIVHDSFRLRSTLVGLPGQQLAK
jgi:hypothetical protein